MFLEVEILPIIARLQSSLTLVITDLPVFKACVNHCRQSQDLLIHDLAGRIVCGEPQLLWNGQHGQEWSGTGYSGNVI